MKKKKNDTCKMECYSEKALNRRTSCHLGQLIDGLRRCYAKEKYTDKEKHYMVSLICGIFFFLSQTCRNN